MNRITINGCSLDEIRQLVDLPFTVEFSFKRVAGNDERPLLYCFIATVPDNGLILCSSPFSLGSTFPVDCINIMAERADFIFYEQPFLN